MTTTHTPGPWKYGMKHGSPNAAFICVTSGNTDIATVDANACHASGQANARLIAVAPELLAALERLASCPDCNADMLSPMTIKAMDDARDAIRKATPSHFHVVLFGESCGHLHTTRAQAEACRDRMDDNGDILSATIEEVPHV